MTDVRSLLQVQYPVKDVGDIAAIDKWLTLKREGNNYLAHRSPYYAITAEEMFKKMSEIFSDCSFMDLNADEDEEEDNSQTIIDESGDDEEIEVGSKRFIIRDYEQKTHLQLIIEWVGESKDYGPGCRFRIIGMVENGLDVVIDKAFLNVKHQVAKRREGVYEIHITERYRGMAGVKELVHRKDSDSFKDIYPELYPGINIHEMVRLFMESDETLLFIIGDPGLGKTMLIKYILKTIAELNEGGIDSLYVKDSTIIEMPSFWAELSAAYEVVVFDDLDKALVRSELLEEESHEAVTNKSTAANQLLSYSNGLFERDTKFIIASNAPDKAIDPALLRPGRCFDLLRFRPLEPAYAKQLWIEKFKLSEEQFEKSFGGLEAITQAHLISERDRANYTTIKPYLEDQSISLRENYYNKNAETMGFKVNRRSTMVQ